MAAVLLLLAGCSGNKSNGGGPGGNGAGVAGNGQGGSARGGASNGGAGGAVTNSGGSNGGPAGMGGGSGGVAGARGGVGGGGPAGGLTTTSYDLDTAHAATATIGPDGGQLTATGADGTLYTLDVPPGALIAPLTLTATPLSNLVIGGTTAAWQTGVDLEPQGTGLVHSATLTVAPAATPPADAAIVLVDKSDGTFAPVGTNGALTASLRHFSVYVVTQVNDARLKESDATATGRLAATDELHWGLVLGRLYEDAQALGLTDAAALAKQALANAIAAVSAAGDSGVTSAGPSTLVPVLLVGSMATDAGDTAVADQANQAALSIFDAWLAALKTQLQTAGASWDLVPAAQAVVSFAKASLPSRTDPAIQFEAALVQGLQAIADQKCDTGDYQGGTSDLTQLAAIADSDGITSPSGDALRTDAATCVPPTITYAAGVPNGTGTSITRASVAGVGGTTQVQLDPTGTAPAFVKNTTTDGCSQYTGGAFSLVSSLSNPSYLSTVDVSGDHADWTTSGNLDATGASWDLTFNGSASAVPYTTPAVNTQVSAQGGGMYMLTVQIHNPRGTAFSVQFDRTATTNVTTTNGPNGEVFALLSYNVSLVTLSCPAAIDVNTGSATWTAADDGGQPTVVNLPPGAHWVTLALQVNISASAGALHYVTHPPADEQGSISASGDIKITAIPPHP